MRTILRAILAVALLLGGGTGDWAPLVAAHDCCCGPVAAPAEDACPCPRPEGPRGPARSMASERQTTVAAPSESQPAGQRRIEPRPEPVGWAVASAAPVSTGFPDSLSGRDPDLGRHLARLSTFRI